MTKFFACLILAAFAGAPLYSQDVPEGPPLAQTPADNGNVPGTLIQPIERAADYLNFFAFGNGIIDSTNEFSGTGSTQTDFGTQFGGGVSASHEFRRGIFSFSYRGDYRDSGDPAYVSGVEQSFSFFYRRMLTRRLTLSFQEDGGTFPQGTVTQQPSTNVLQQYVQTSPFESHYKFDASTITVGYRQTARLSYEATGTFAISRYSGNVVNYGNDDVVGTASVLYLLNGKTTLSGTYQSTYFHYQRGAGTADQNGGYLTLSRALPDHWTMGISAGASHVDSSGSYPVSVFGLYHGTLIPLVFVGHYHTTANLPYLSGSISRTWHHFVASATGGETITPGNGVYLTSRTLGVSGIFSYSTRRSNISAFGSWSRLASASVVATTSSFRSEDLGAGYSYNLIRHLGSNIRYDHTRYLFQGSSVNALDNRISFGIYFSSKDIPIAVF